MGFPAGSDSGAAARGTVRTTDADGWHLVEADCSYGRTIEPGFSGAPAIADDRHRRLLGMIDLTNADERRGALIPVEALMRALAAAGGALPRAPSLVARRMPRTSSGVTS